MPTANVARINYRLTGGLLDSGSIAGGSVNTSCLATGLLTVAHGMSSPAYQGYGATQGPSSVAVTPIVTTMTNLGSQRIALYGSDSANITFAVSSMVVSTLAVTSGTTVIATFNWIAIR